MKKNAQNARRKLTIQKASDYTGFTTGQIHRAARTGKLTYYRLGDFGPLAFDPSDLDEWLASMRVEATDNPADATADRQRVHA